MTLPIDLQIPEHAVARDTTEKSDKELGTYIRLEMARTRNPVVVRREEKDGKTVEIVYSWT